MTTQQLSRMLARNLAVDDPANLSGDAALDVLQAINAGLVWFYAEAPAILKRTTLSLVFKAPAAVNLTASAQYSTILSGTPFLESWQGCGVRVDGINPDNEIAGVSSLLDAWLPSTLTAAATVLFDAAVIAATIERITSDVRSYTGNIYTTTILKLDTSGLIDRRRELRILDPGHPSFYRFEPLSIAAGGATTGLLRIYPAPVVDITVRFEAEISGAVVTFAQLSQGATVPITDGNSSLLIPLCESFLSYSPLWANDRTRQDARANALQIVETRIKKLPQSVVCPDNTVGTPKGF